MRLILSLTALLLLAVACGGGQASTPSPGVSQSPTPKPATAPPTLAPTASPTPVPTPAPTPAPTPVATPGPAVDLSLSRARQGGFLAVRLLNPPPALTAARVMFRETPYPMLPEGDHWYALIGLDTQMAPGDYSVEVDAPDRALAVASASIGDGGFQFESLTLPPSSTDLVSDTTAVDQERATLNQIYSGLTPLRKWSGPWIMPAVGIISNPFGLQRSINGGPYYPHTGTDIANDKGTPVVAAAPGTVVLARPMYLYGNAVVIDHGAGVFSSYNHLDSIVATEGQQIAEGQLLGLMGETGFVNGPHVHWEAIISGVRTDATLWTQADIEP